MKRKNCQNPPKHSKKAKTLLSQKSIKELSTLQQILTCLNVGSKDWDVLMVGDGSGGDWRIGCGWSAVVIDHYTATRKLLCGGMNNGTIGLGELMPYLHGLLWYSRSFGAKRLKELVKAKQPPEIKVHILTDSQSTANQGNGTTQRYANLEMWAAMDGFAKLGYSIKWHWMERNSTGLNTLTDHISRESRIAIEKVKMPEGATVYDFSPNIDDSE